MNFLALPAMIVATGSHASLEIALPIIAAGVVAKILWRRGTGRPLVGGKIVVRCSKGHLFRTMWSSPGSLTSIRLGGARFQQCPIGSHWSLVKPVNDNELTDDERRELERQSGAT